MNDLHNKLQAIKSSANQYDKQHKTFKDQLSLLKSRGLHVPNEAFALRKLKHINYYRLSAYFLPFQYPKNSADKDRFLPDTQFEDILGLYYFDTDLRRIIFEAIERLEIYFRTQITYIHSERYGPFGYLEYENLKCDPDFFDRLQSAIKEETSRSKETFVRHFKEKYDSSDLPIWAMVEVVSMSTLSKLYAAFKSEQQKEIAKAFPTINKKLLKSWLHALTVLRNMCAHHSRVWNKTFGVRFEIPRKHSDFQEIAHHNDKVFFAMSVMIFMLESIGEELAFRDKVVALLKSHPNVDTHAMGFPDNWQEHPFWRDDE